MVYPFGWEVDVDGSIEGFIKGVTLRVDVTWFSNFSPIM